MMRGMHGMYGYGTIWMLIFWVLLILIGIYLLMKFVNGGTKNRKTNYNINNNKDSPLEILQMRLAKGEIDGAEYERLKSVIERDKRSNENE